MSTTLNALKTKLDWQKQELLEGIAQMEHEISSQQQKIKILEQQLDKKTASTGMINPEIEMNRLNFMMMTRETIEHHQLRINDLTDHQNTLRSKLERTHIELKMLEKYLLRSMEEARLKEQKQQEHRLDEWALLTREIA